MSYLLTHQEYSTDPLQISDSSTGFLEQWQSAVVKGTSEASVNTFQAVLPLHTQENSSPKLAAEMLQAWVCITNIDSTKSPGPSKACVSLN